MAALVCIPLMFAAQDADAQRGIRVDQPGFGFNEFTGENWYGAVDEVNPFVNGGIMALTLPFGINFSGEPRTPTNIAVFSSYGWLTLGQGCSGSDTWGCGNFAYLLPWDAAGSVGYIRATTVIGLVDPIRNADGLYHAEDAVRAIQFRWYASVDNQAFQYQVVLLDMSDETGRPGDFDLEVNFGIGEFLPPPTGAQFLAIGPEYQHLSVQNSQNPYAYLCYRGGELGFNCETVIDPPPPPADVPEPSTIAMVGLGLLAALRTRGRALRQRRGTQCGYNGRGAAAGS